jgi:hypothetical protein
MAVAIEDDSARRGYGKQPDALVLRNLGVVLTAYQL